MLCRIFLMAAFFAVPSVPQETSTCSSEFIEIVGEAEIGHGLTREQADQLALDDAIRNAMHRACPAEIYSHAVVLNNALVVDLIDSDRRGLLVEREILARETITEPLVREGVRITVDRRRVRIRTRFAAQVGESDAGFQIRFVEMPPTYSDGQEATVRVSSTKDCYVHLFSVSADLSVTVFFPSSYRRDNRLLAGQTLEFPNSADYRQGIHFHIGVLPQQKSPHVTEWFLAIASKQPVDLVGGTGIEEALGRVRSEGETASLEQLFRRLASVRRSDVARAVHAYEVYLRDPRK